MRFERITVDPHICNGKPCIRGIRFPVSRLLGLLASGETRETVLKAYPYLQTEDIDEALRYAKRVLVVPSIERDGRTPVDQQYWVDAALEMFGRVFGGATAYPRAKGILARRREGRHPHQR